MNDQYNGIPQKHSNKITLSFIVDGTVEGFILEHKVLYGFSSSPLLSLEIKSEFSHKRVLIKQLVS